MCRGLKTCPLVMLVFIITACNAPSERLNAPPQGSTEQPHPLQEHFVYMQDNALLADMCFADVHFVPHTAELNGLGARRLGRYAELLAQYGGTLYYDTEMKEDDELVQARLEHAAEFLELAGLETDKFELAVGGPGGRGMKAKEAVSALGAAEASQCGKSAGPSSVSSLSGK